MSAVKTKKGDTLIEVVFGFAIFSAVAAFTIAIMNSSLTGVEGALELTLARNEIDAQAETLRFVHNSFLNDRNYTQDYQEYRNLWIAIRSLAVSDASNIPRANDSMNSCGPLFDSDPVVEPNTIYNLSSLTDPGAKAFVLNTRKLKTSSDFSDVVITADSSTGLFHESGLNPRVIYTNGTSTTDDSLTEDELSSGGTAPYNEVARVEGLYNIVVKESGSGDGLSRFYDFHIYTCWVQPGLQRPTTIGTIVRLYNPEYIEESYF